MVAATGTLSTGEVVARDENEIRQKISIGEAILLLNTMVKTGRAICLWGAPGIGKSQAVAAFAAMKNRKLVEILASQYDAVDARGIPILSNDVTGEPVTKFTRPEFMPTEGEGVIFLDELNRAPVDVQNAFMQLVLNRKLGNYVLPDGWIIVAACNNISDGGGVNLMTAAMCNRFYHFEVEPTLDEWLVWAMDNDVHHMVLAFHDWRKTDGKESVFNKFDKTAKAFPTPRSWEALSDALKVSEEDELPINLIAHNIRASVGSAAGAEFLAFYRLFENLTMINDVFLNPDVAAIPQRKDVLYALCVAIANRTTTNNINNVVKYLERLTNEFNVMTVRMMTRKHPELKQAPIMTTWGIKYAAILS